MQEVNICAHCPLKPKSDAHLPMNFYRGHMEVPSPSKLGAVPIIDHSFSGGFLESVPAFNFKV
ncbi:predicted protein [Sclerotinia sclerotiorum 1980 UF-70]|uniref:Uncharacterized protein n=2 Tax=Sclerotinia sclerotiorum (strain ATCC 18683 / 1980 / Ss-1) TaxID=665079 RepID=A7EP90_SCLS1|nr:predicted protein [Sclerotinia sclerotiorum 1980 UF-70]APA10385.1 hypothetical protein sscle_06g051550 [Sclerotinia sclerotiorum 1980 UF-70]EDO04656.1 predicted protein [Sclerotinia sclerotiorum 1980 UF-70]